MSYAVRNTLVLLTTLILLIAGGWLYLIFIFDGDISSLEQQLAQKERENRRLTQKADNFMINKYRHSQIIYEYENHNKELLANNNVATVYDFLRFINRGLAHTSMNFSLRDSVINRDHGIIRVQLDGEGTYRGLFNFLTILEQSKPITRISDIRLAPVSGSLDRVQYIMNVGFYYARGTTSSNPDILINTSIAPRIYNPFYPLVHSVPENVDNLPNIDRSRLIGLVRNGAYIIDHRNSLQFLSIGDEVYLGTLASVNMNEETATFRLNRGGISDVVVLKINSSN